tara:strand:- start:10747 stop:10938 length:192 start_codon:yes stop_codon:yes gene_type:complete
MLLSFPPSFIRRLVANVLFDGIEGCDLFQNLGGNGGFSGLMDLMELAPCMGLAGRQMNGAFGG